MIQKLQFKTATTVSLYIFFSVSNMITLILVSYLEWTVVFPMFLGITSITNMYHIQGVKFCICSVSPNR